MWDYLRTISFSWNQDKTYMVWGADTSGTMLGEPRCLSIQLDLEGGASGCRRQVRRHDGSLATYATRDSFAAEARRDTLDTLLDDVWEKKRIGSRSGSQIRSKPLE